MKQPRAYEQAQKLQAQLGTVELAVVKRHVFPLMADEHGTSVGASIDALLCDVAKEGDVVQTVTLRLFDDQLDAVTDYYRGPE